MKSGQYKLIVPQDNAVVTKHNKLIEARYSLTLQEQRLILWVVSQIEPEDTDIDGFSIPIKELARFLGVERNKNIYKQMEAITRGLVTKGVEVRNLEKETLLQTTWLDHAFYRFGEGIVEIAVSDKLKPYLIELNKHFTSISLRVAVSLKSSYSIRIYELLKQYQKIGQREITVADLRLYLGIKPKQYEKYAWFKRRTVLSSQQEINAKSDIHFEFEEIKRGRKVHSLKFTITKNHDYGEVLKLPLGDTKGFDLVEALKKHGVKDQTAWAIVNAYVESDPQRVSWHVKELESQLGKGRKIKSPAGWLVKAIDADHRPQKSLFQKDTEQAEKDAKAVRQERQARESRIMALDERITSQSKAYRAYLGREIDKWREGLTAANEAEIMESLISGETKAYVIDDLKRKAWGSIMNQGRVMAYMEAHVSPLPYLDQAAYFKAENLSPLSELEAELAALKA